MKDIFKKNISLKIYLNAVKYHDYDEDEDAVSATNDNILLVINFIRLQAQKQIIIDVYPKYITIGEAYKFYLEHGPIRGRILRSLDTAGKRARMIESDSDVTTDSEGLVIMEQHFVVFGSETLFRKNHICTPGCILLLQRKEMMNPLWI